MPPYWAYMVLTSLHSFTDSPSATLADRMDMVKSPKHGAQGIQVLLELLAL